MKKVNLKKNIQNIKALNEFRDGILLFDLTSKKVWTKAVKILLIRVFMN